MVDRVRSSCTWRLILYHLSQKPYRIAIFLLSPFEMILPDVILSFLFKTKQKHTTPDA